MNGGISEALKRLAAEYGHATTQKERDRIWHEIVRVSYRQERDRDLWLKVANGIGWRAFQDLYFEFLSVVEDAKRRGNPLRNPASAFQKRLNRYTGHNEPKPEGGAA